VTRLLAIVLAAIEGGVTNMVTLEAANELFCFLLATLSFDHSEASLVVILITTRDSGRLSTAITRSLDRHLTGSTKSRMTRSVVNMLTTT